MSRVKQCNVVSLFPTSTKKEKKLCEKGVIRVARRHIYEIELLYMPSL